MKLTKTTNGAQSGFTIIELMISTVVFSLVLMSASVAIIQIGKKFSRGVTYTRTQEVARSTVEEISQSIQFTNESIKVPNYPVDADTVGPEIEPGSEDTFFFCVGPRRFTFAVDRKKSDTTDVDNKEKAHVFWVDLPASGCANAVSTGPASLDETNPSGDAAVNKGYELLDDNMRITRLSVSPYSNGSWRISLSIAKGDDDLLFVRDGRTTCEGSIYGAEHCAVSEISVTVNKRVQ